MNLSMKRELDRGAVFSVVDFVHAIIEDALGLNASDIHIHPHEHVVRIRFRIDGLLQDMCEFDRHIFSEVVSRIKIMSNLRTDEHKSPQDGRFTYTVDVRVSCVPSQYGESVVMRVLRTRKNTEMLSDLGFFLRDVEKIEAALKKKWGMVLVTGPTGSGKTTTLYTLLNMLNESTVSVVTIEDPIEYALSGIKQIQTHARAGLTFASGLRSLLRQDPDIIMVGEIRDTETASIAINTALTGHLLLSTLHTVDAATAIPRFLDMGIEPFLVASTLRVIIAQRLVRKVCQSCKQEKVVDVFEQDMCQQLFGKVCERSFYGFGCDACKGSGYDGRVVVGEVLVVEDNVRELVIGRRSAGCVRKTAIDAGMIPLTLDGVQKVEAGLTSVQEIIRCLHE